MPQRHSPRVRLFIEINKYLTWRKQPWMNDKWHAMVDLQYFSLHMGWLHPMNLTLRYESESDVPPCKRHDFTWSAQPGVVYEARIFLLDMQSRAKDWRE